jgi:hypothetical protein
MRHLIFLVTATVASADPVSIAKQNVVGMGEPEIVPVGRGWVARFRQTHAGLPVMGGEIVLRIDHDGKILRQRGQRFDLSGLDVKPQVSSARAVEIAHALSGGETRATLAVDPEAVGGPRLVWVVRGTPIPQLLENAVHLVDARSGQHLKRINLIKFGKASVFLQNPIETPQPSARDIPTDFEPTNPDGYLEGALLKSYDCIDTGQDSMVNLGLGVNFNVHICTVTPEAKAANYDYTSYSPAMEPFTAPANGCPNAPAGGAPQPLDEFSEQHMYWHVANAYAFFRGLFAANNRADFRLRAQPLAMAVNLCTPDFSGGLGSANLTGPLVPFDNAFFSPGANNIIAETLIMGQDSIMFGQGSKYDFAYDADVIDHEFTHAVIDTLGKLTRVGQEDGWGLKDDQGAMNEGLADYFSSVIGGDPILGEYAGRNIPSGGAEGAVRDLTNMDLCGRDRWGEVHQDSQAFSSSLWGARTAIAGDPKSAGFDAAKAQKFDRAVLAAIASFASNVDMTTAAEDFSKETALLLDADSQTKLEASFTAHKILPQCDRIIDWSPGDKKDILGLDGTDSPYAPSGAKRVPGFVQWKIDVPVGADSITAQMTLAAQSGSFSSQGGLTGGGGTPKLEVIVGPPEMPIGWVANSDGGNEVASAMFSGTKGAVNATLTGLPVGTSYVMIVNSGGGIIAQNITFTTSCSVPGGCQPDMAVARPADSSGCRCDLGGHSTAPISTPPLIALGFVVAWVWRRRATSR